MCPKTKPVYVTPSLESITVRGKYAIPETEFSVVENALSDAVSSGALSGWFVHKRIGQSITLTFVGRDFLRELASLTEKASDIQKAEKRLYEILDKEIKKIRAGVPISLLITAVEHLNNGILTEVECRSAMWYRISKYMDESFTENQIQEALMECKRFVKQVMSIFKGKEVEPVSVYPIIPKMEIQGRLLNLGLKKIVNQLNKAEKHIVRNNFVDSLKSSRTAFEKMIDWQMKKRGLDQTNNYKNDLERLESKGYLDSETTKLIHTFYRCLSNIAVHEKGEVEPGIYEAQMGYGMTLIILQYIMNKLP